MRCLRFAHPKLSPLMTGILFLAVVGSQATMAADEIYTVQCGENATSAAQCKVDKKTYIGWRTYHATCHVCHAQDAVGSTFAPNLVDKMKEISKERYLESMANGYTGQIGVMPPWKDDPNVNKRFEDLYAYLMARSDGKLPPGRPKRLKKKK